MRAIVFDRFGVPEEVLQVRDVPVPEPGRNEARVRMKFVPINPSDLMTVRGEYGRLPSLPATPGFEGVGVVDKVGGGLVAKLRGLRPGRRVAVLNGKGGNWAEQVVVPARQLVPVPDSLPDEQIATFFVNPATALVMVNHVLRVPPGAWLLQTAAGSALGRMIIRLGVHQGFKTINLIRRADGVDELKKLGADAVVVTSSEPVQERIDALTGGQKVRHALDCVGGTMGLEALKALGPGGRLLLYGTLSGEPIPLSPRLLLTGQKSIEGFWLSDWTRHRSILTMLGLFRQIMRLLHEGILTSPVEATYAMEQIRDAVVHAARPGRSGKVLVRM
jgi:NADPH:quinone reductase-like Zn-dependent oxidoreductase